LNLVKANIKLSSKALKGCSKLSLSHSKLSSKPLKGSKANIVFKQK
jgi:hypothetical protein